jgi:hypothetical protein
MHLQLSNCPIEHAGTQDVGLWADDRAISGAERLHATRRKIVDYASVQIFDRPASLSDEHCLEMVPIMHPEFFARVTSASPRSRPIGVASVPAEIEYLRRQSGSFFATPGRFERPVRSC